MKIELSDQATKRIEGVIGNADPNTLNRIFERVSKDQHLLMSVMADSLPSGYVEAIRECIADADAGRVQPFAEVDDEIRRHYGFSSKSQ